MQSAGRARHIAYFALGTNLGDRRENLRRAVEAVGQGFDITALSPIYETEPAYQPDQPRFYNQCGCATTALSSQDALAHLKRSEAALGRVPGPRYGPRTIDLDLLFYDDLVLSSPDLTLPHPLLHERAFVLVPLNDIAPDLVHPTFSMTIQEFLTQLPAAERRKVWPAPPA